MEKVWPIKRRPNNHPILSDVQFHYQLTLVFLSPSLRTFTYLVSLSIMDSLGGYLPYAVSGLLAAGSAYFFLNRKSNVLINAVGYRAGQPTQTLTVEPILDPKAYKNFKLVEKIVISHNTAV